MQSMAPLHSSHKWGIKKKKCFVVYEIYLFDFDYGEEVLPVRVGQIEIKLDRDFDKRRLKFV